VRRPTNKKRKFLEFQRNLVEDRESHLVEYRRNPIKMIKHNNDIVQEKKLYIVDVSKYYNSFPSP